MDMPVSIMHLKAVYYLMGEFCNGLQSKDRQRRRTYDQSSGLGLIVVVGYIPQAPERPCLISFILFEH